MSSAERKRRYRERKAAGLRALSVALPVDDRVTAALVMSGHYPPEALESDEALARSIEHLLDKLAEQQEGNAVPRESETAGE